MYLRRGLIAEWNQRCEKILPPGEVKRQLFDYVDWTDKQSNCVTGCKSLEDFCIGKDKCMFSIKTLSSKRKTVEVLPFDFAQAERFLNGRYKGDAYLMLSLLQNWQFF